MPCVLMSTLWWVPLVTVCRVLTGGHSSHAFDNWQQLCLLAEPPQSLVVYQSTTGRQQLQAHYRCYHSALIWLLLNCRCNAQIKQALVSFTDLHSCMQVVIDTCACGVVGILYVRLVCSTNERPHVKWRSAKRGAFHTAAGCVDASHVGGSANI